MSAARAPAIEEPLGNAEVGDDCMDTADNAVNADNADNARVQFVAPPFWSRVTDVEWISQTHEAQNRMDMCATNEDQLGLLAEHPQGAEFVREFRAPDVERGVKHLQLLMRQATEGLVKADEVSAAATEEIKRLTAQVQEEDPVLAKTALDEQRREGLEQVKQSSQALREVDLNSEEIPAQILLREFGESQWKRVEMMDEDERFEAMAEVRRTRTVARHKLSLTWAERLVGGSGTNDPASHSPPLAVRISTAGEGGIDELHTQATQAQEMKQEARATLDALKKSLEDDRTRKDACRRKKTQATDKLNKTRRALKQALLDLQARSDEFELAFRDNEILRLEDKRLDANVRQKEEELAAAEPACRDVEAACEEWESHAKDQATAVQNIQLMAAADAVNTTAETLGIEALNLDVGLRLLSKVHQEQASKVSRLERALQATDRCFRALKEDLMKSPSCPAKAKAKKHKELFQKKEKLADLDGRIRALEASCQALAVTISSGESNRRSLEALTVHGFRFQEPELEEQSTHLIEEAYPDLELPPEADEEVEEDELADESQAFALVSTSPDMKAVLGDMVRAMMLQEKADLEFRGKAQATTCPPPTLAEPTASPKAITAVSGEEADRVAVEGNDAGKGGCDWEGRV